MPTEVKSPRRRGRPRKSELGEEAPELRRRGRPRRSDGSDAAAEAPGPKKRGRPKRADASDVAEPPEPKRRGRLRRSDASEAVEEPSQPKRRGRPRQPDSSNAGPSQQRPPTAEPSDIDSPDVPSPDQAKRSYPFLAAKQREIPVSTISSTWTPLQSPSLTLARQILHFSERPVLQSLAPGPRREVAASAIRTASKRLASKLSKGLPFPPASKAAVKASKKSKTPRADGREAELDFEAVASEMEALEGRLDPLLHSVEVLRAEERRMQEVLSREAAALEVLERNGREERKLWREGLRRKGHPLVPDRWDPDGDGGDKLVLTPRGEEVPSEWLFTVCPANHHLIFFVFSTSTALVFFYSPIHIVFLSRVKDFSANETQNSKPSLPLSTLTSHITSLHNNVRPLEGLDRAMADSEAAIRRVLALALEPERYEAAIMAERE